MKFLRVSLYTPLVNYKEEYFTKFAYDEVNLRDKMMENCTYALKIADKLYNQEKYNEAIYYYEEAIKLGGNQKMINLKIGSCRRRTFVLSNKPGL